MFQQEKCILNSIWHLHELPEIHPRVHRFSPNCDQGTQVEMVSGFCGPPDGFAGGKVSLPNRNFMFMDGKKKRNLSPKAGFQSRYPSGFRQGKKRFFVIFIFELILRLRPLIVLEKRFEIHISWGSSNLPKTSYNDTFGGTAEQPGM